MGLFDRNRSGSATISVSLGAAELAPGQTVDVQYEVGGTIDDKCRALRAGLSCTATYIDEERGRDANGHPIEREVGHLVQVHDDEQPLALAVGPGQAQFTLPADAPVSSAGAVDWSAWVQIDRDGGRDVAEQAAVAVRAAIPSSDVVPDASNDGVTLHGAPAAVRAGDTVRGTVTVNVAEQTKAALVVRLNRRQTYVASPVQDVPPDTLLIDSLRSRNVPYVAHDELGAAQTEAAGRRSFEPGAAVEVPFSLTVPADAGPSTTYPYGQVDWRLEALLDRRLHQDLGVVVPIAIV